MQNTDSFFVFLASVCCGPWGQRGQAPQKQAPPTQPRGQGWGGPTVPALWWPGVHTLRGLCFMWVWEIWDNVLAHAGPWQGSSAWCLSPQPLGAQAGSPTFLPRGRSPSSVASLSAGSPGARAGVCPWSGPGCEQTVSFRAQAESGPAGGGFGPHFCSGGGSGPAEHPI